MSDTMLLGILQKKEFVTDLQGDVLDLLTSVAERRLLTQTDFLLLRDLRELSGCDSFSFYLCLVLLFVAKNRGSLCLFLAKEQLQQKIEEIFPVEKGPRYRDAKQKELLDWIEGQIGRLISGDGISYLPLICVGDGESRRIYFQKYYVDEQKVVEQIKKLLGKPLKDLDEIQIEKYQSAFQQVVFPVADPANEIQLNKEQMQAVALSLLSDFVIISGGPGTGKTSIISALLRILVRAGYKSSRILMAAPTGKAAQRLTDSLQLSCERITSMVPQEESLLEVSASTLHRVLRFSPKRGCFVHHAGNPLPADLIIVDEVSMLDIGLMSAFLDAVKPSTKLIFLGDRDQLPSVEAGTVLADLLPKGDTIGYSKEVAEKINLLSKREIAIDGKHTTDHAVILHKRYRSQRSILNIADGVNEQRLDIISQFPILSFKDGAEFNWPENSITEGALWAKASTEPVRRFEERELLLAAWAEQFYVSKRAGNYCSLVKQASAINLLKKDGVRDAFLDTLFKEIEKSRVLTLVKNGPWGAVAVNRMLSATLSNALGIDKNSYIYSGLPVMIRENDYQNELFNGEVGVMLAVADQGLYAFFKKGGEYVSVPAALLPAYEIAFAITVHKSQGSEYSTVLIVLPDDPALPLLSKEILYTGLTRAKEQVVIYGMEEVLTAAIKRGCVRESGIDIW